MNSNFAPYQAAVQDITNVPFAPEELLARVIAVVRRSYRDPVPLRRVIEFGQLEIDILNRTARFGGSALPLTSLEPSLFYCWRPARAR
jgi:DNA-binding response OmpR family regulator